MKPLDGPIDVVLAGARGHGRWHRANLRRLAAAGRVRLVGVCELSPVGEEELEGLGSPEQSADLATLNLIAHLRDGAGLLVPPERTGAFMRVVEAVRTAPDPISLTANAWRTATDPPAPRRMIPGIDALTAESAATFSLYSELGAPWAISRFRKEVHRR